MPKVVKERRFRGPASLSTNRKGTTTTLASSASYKQLEGSSDVAFQKPASPKISTTVVAAGEIRKENEASSLDPVSTAKIPSPSEETTQRKQSESALQTTKRSSVSSQDDPKEQPHLSRGQRKRQAKRDQYLRKEKMIMSSLRVKHAEDQAKRIDGLDALKAALLSTISTTTNDNGGTADNNNKGKQPATMSKTAIKQHSESNLLQTNRGRQRLLQKEATQMNLVLQHPAYQADPIGTMREHLQNTMQLLAPVSRPEKNTSQIKAKQEVVKRKRKKNKVRVTRSKSR